jgi:hypothetical protein
MDATVLDHVDGTDGEHIGYDVDIDVKAHVQSVDCTITVGDDQT